jgi:hypothetical protein
LGRGGPLQAVLDALCEGYDAAPGVLERDLLELVTGLAEAGLGEVK